MKRITGFHVFQAAIISAVAAVVVTGFILIGPPSQERARRFDQQRLNDLTQIQYGIENYFQANKKLPESLSLLQEDHLIFSPIRDPKSKDIYEYTVTGTSTYSLCAVFEAEATQDQNDSIIPPFQNGKTLWKHGAERTCALLEAKQLSAALPEPYRVID